MLIKAVIFDLGGVLVRTEDRTPRVQLAQRLGMTYAELSDLIFNGDSAKQAAVGAITTEAHWEYIRQRLQLSSQEFQRVPRQRLQLSSQEFQRVPEEFWSGDQVDQSLVALLRSLRPQYKTALLSNAWDDLRDVLANSWRIIDAFDEAIISAEVGVVKPEARIYQIALDRLAVNANEAVFVDDFVENVTGARQVGMHAIHFQHPTQAKDELLKLLEKN